MLFAATLALASAAEPIPAQWDLEPGTQHRWHVQTEMNVPGHVWVFADKNLDVRAHNLGMQAVVDCTVGERRRRAVDVACVLTDVSLSGATYAYERGTLQPVLEEMDAKLTGAPLELVFGTDGRIRHVDIEPNELVGFSNRRLRFMDQWMRSFVMRAVAPLDLSIPDDGMPAGGWPHEQALLVSLPQLTGTPGRVKMTHHAERYDAERALVRSGGRGVLRSGGMTLDMTLDGHTVFDLEAGRVSEAAWTVHGRPSPSSGILVRDYKITHYLQALGSDDSVTLPPTIEWGASVAKD